MVLLWIQVFSAILALVVRTWGQSMFAWLPCDNAIFSLQEVGICSCADESICWTNQLVYRTGAATTAVFLLLLIMSVSGCVKSAAQSAVMAKFMAIPIIAFLSLLIPNKFLSGFGALATVVSAVFLVMQTVLLIDLAYVWNETWFAKAQAARSRIDRRMYIVWIVLIVGSAVTLLVGSLVMAAYLFAVVPEVGSRVLVTVAYLVALALLLVSITEWCKHGALLTSAVIMAYAMWLAYGSLASMPNRPEALDKQTFRAVVGLALGAVCLATLALSVAPKGGASAREAVAAPASADGGGPPAADAEAGEGSEAEEISGPGFAVHSLVHAAAALAVVALLAPYEGGAAFSAQVVATAGALLLYGWSLVAPRVLTSRRF